MTEHELIEGLKKEFPDHQFSLGPNEMTEQGLRRSLMVDGSSTTVKIRWIKGVATNLEIHRDIVLEESKQSFVDSISSAVSQMFLAPTRRIVENGHSS